ncbi:hypothetical protein LCGC14_2198870 [marine sediment metagenome]|uniref:Uncharacterized protein n=1 Tax=marine sediment metagenome TaxID=412755 RepID=A0A0F9DHH2_9ZZZZ
MIPLNGNVLVTPMKDQVKGVFTQSDSRRDLQYAKVDEVTERKITLLKRILEFFFSKPTLKVGDTIIYNPRNLTNIVYKGKLKGIVHEGNIIAIL